MAEAKKPAGKKIIDVSHPGKTAPSGNSKSVIVTSRPIMKDPMVVDDQAQEAVTDPASLSTKTSEAVIQPLDSSETKDAVAEAEKPETSAKSAKPVKTKKSDPKKTIAELAVEADAEPTTVPEPDSEPEPAAETTTESEPTPVPEPEAEPTSSPDTEPESEPAAVPEETAAPSAESPKPDEQGDNSKTNTRSVTEAEEAAALEQEKRDKELQKLADSKKYYLPINTVEKRRSKRVVILGVFLSLILILAWVDIAADAGLIKIDGVKPVTHFFSN